MNLRRPSSRLCSLNTAMNRSRRFLASLSAGSRAQRFDNRKTDAGRYPSRSRVRTGLLNYLLQFATLSRRHPAAAVVSSSRRRQPRTLLFLTAGPYFFAHQRTVCARYEALSSHFDGFILSFVSRKRWAHASIGNFELIGRFVSGRTYGRLPLRLLIRTVFVLVMGLRLHFFRRRIDLIVAYEPLLNGLLAWLLSRVTGARFVVEVNNDFQKAANWNGAAASLLAQLKLWYVTAVMPFVLNRADGVRLLYPTQVAGLRGLKPRDRYYCFHDFVATSLFEPAGPVAERCILFIGHPWYLKGVDILIRAFNDVSPEYPGWTLRIVGHLPEKELYRDLYAGNPRIEFMEAVMADDVVPLMRRCSIFVLASRSEGMPRVIIEAMASGKLVIASRVGGIPHYLRHGETALLFDPGDLGGLRELMREALADEDYVRQIAENGRRYMAEQLSDARHIEAFTQMVQAVGARGAGPD